MVAQVRSCGLLDRVREYRSRSDVIDATEDLYTRSAAVTGALMTKPKHKRVVHVECKRRRRGSGIDQPRQFANAQYP